MVMVPEGARNQERFCWRGPAAIYLTGLDCAKVRLSQPVSPNTRVIEEDDKDERCLSWRENPRNMHGFEPKPPYFAGIVAKIRVILIKMPSAWADDCSVV
jgi:hypothetical protein